VTAAPDVSVVIPTRNRRALVGDTVASALAQMGPAIEVVVVDDGSTDGTWEALGQIADPRLRPLRHRERRGVAEARNTGIAAAKGRWVAFLDDDDLWRPDKLAAQVTAMEATGGRWSWTSVIVVDQRRRAVRELPAPPADGILRTLLTEPVSAVPAGASTVVADTELVRSVGAFDPAFSQLADWDLWLRLAQRAAGTACADVLVAYVQHADSMLLTDPLPLLQEYARLAAKHAELVALEGTSWDERRFSRWVASGHRRAGRRVAAARVYVTIARRHRSAGDLLRAGGAMLGERAWRPFNSARPDPSAVRPAWLEDYDR
jgi:glycosyltransferase involved in cell wall biosynthesis